MRESLISIDDDQIWNFTLNAFMSIQSLPMHLDK